MLVLRPGIYDAERGKKEIGRELLVKMCRDLSGNAAHNADRLPPG